MMILGYDVCSAVEGHQYFGRTCWIHIATLKMGAAYSSETLVPPTKNVWRHFC